MESINTHTHTHTHTHTTHACRNNVIHKTHSLKSTQWFGGV